MDPWLRARPPGSPWRQLSGDLRFVWVWLIYGEREAAEIYQRGAEWPGTGAPRTCWNVLHRRLQLDVNNVDQNAVWLGKGENHFPSSSPDLQQASAPAGWWIQFIPDDDCSSGLCKCRFMQMSDFTVILYKHVCTDTQRCGLTCKCELMRLSEECSFYSGQSRTPTWQWPRGDECSLQRAKWQIYSACREAKVNCAAECEWRQFCDCGGQTNSD